MTRLVWRCFRLRAVERLRWEDGCLMVDSVVCECGVVVRSGDGSVGRLTGMQVASMQGRWCISRFKADCWCISVTGYAQFITMEQAGMV